MLLDQSGVLQQMVQEIEHHDGSFSHALQTHDSGTASSSTKLSQSVPRRSNVTYATTPQPPIQGNISCMECLPEFLSLIFFLSLRLLKALQLLEALLPRERRHYFFVDLATT